MMNGLTKFALVSTLAGLAGCGGPTPPAHETAETTATASHTDPPVSTTSVDDDPDEGPQSKDAPSGPPTGDVDPLDVLLKKGDKGFPASTESDSACVGAVGLVGDSSKDYDDLAKHCGAGTGMKAITRKIQKHLNASTHPRDIFDFKMLGGFCYRFFVVGAPGLDVFNIKVERPNGAVLSLAETKEGIAILDPKAPWCKKHDREFHIVVEATGKSTGDYTFGIWARPSQ